MEDRSGIIIETYRKGDFTKRLHLFLDYVDLRAEFMEIEHRECVVVKPSLSGAVFSPKPVPRENLFRRLAGALNSLF